MELKHPELTIQGRTGWKTDELLLVALFVRNTDCIWVRRNARQDKIMKQPIPSHNQKRMLEGPEIELGLKKAFKEDQGREKSCLA